MTASIRAFITARITPADAAGNFVSQEAALDKFFAQHAYPNDLRGLGSTFVLRRRPTDPSTLPEVLGFYTLSMAVIESAQASQVITGKLPRYPIPAALIGRLAIDHRAQGHGLGAGLLADALARTLWLSDDIGCAGVVVDAKNAGAEAFYSKYGFVTVDGTAWPRRMFITMGTVRASASP